MNVLIVYASKHGSTREIAEAIAAEIEIAGFRSHVHDAASVSSLEGVDAVVLGSAVYVGQWQESAVNFIEKFQDGLRQLPVWLFSSGPIGQDPFPKEDPPATPDLIERTGARDYRSFAGRLDRARLGFGERLVSRVVRAPEGDFRQWQEIRGWGRTIARELTDGIPARDQWNGATAEEPSEEAAENRSI